MHRLAAVDVDRLPGHEIAGGRGQEHHRADEIGRELHALDGAAGDAGGEIVSRGRLHLGVALCHAGRDGVHRDAELADLARERAGEADDARFRGRVVQPVGRALPHPRGGDVDDLAAPSRLHGGKHRAAGEEHAAQVDRHHPVPLLDRDLEPGAPRQHAHQRGVVDEHVDRPETIERRLRHGLGRVLAGDVGGEADGLAPLRGERLGHGFRRRAVDVGGDHAGARLGEFLGVDLADALAAPGDDDGASGQIKALAHAGASQDEGLTLHGTPRRRQAYRKLWRRAAARNAERCIARARSTYNARCSRFPMAVSATLDDAGERPRSLPARLYLAHERLAIGGGTLLALLLVWEALGRSGLVDPLFISSPTQIVKTGWQLGHDADFWNDVAVSASEFLLGYGAAAAIAVPLGLAVGLSKRLQYMLSPFVDTLNAVPRVTLLPLIIIWFGIGIWSKVAVVFLGAVIPILINTQSAVKTSEARFIRVARSFCASRGKVFSSIVLPGTVPVSGTGLAAGAGRALPGLVVGVLSASTGGLGHVVADAGDAFQAAIVCFGVLIFRAAGLSGVGLLDAWERRCEKCRPAVR